jgi:hypothetical protein
MPATEAVVLLVFAQRMIWLAVAQRRRVSPPLAKTMLGSPMTETIGGNELPQSFGAGPALSVAQGALPHPLAVLELRSSDATPLRTDRRGIQGTLVERFLELPHGPELVRLSQQRLGTIILSRRDRRGCRVAKLGGARRRSFEQPHSLEQAAVASGQLRQDVRQALRRDILALEDLEHSG